MALNALDGMLISRESAQRLLDGDVLMGYPLFQRFIIDSSTGSVAVADKSGLMASYLNLFTLPTAKFSNVIVGYEGASIDIMTLPLCKKLVRYLPCAPAKATPALQEPLRYAEVGRRLYHGILGLLQMW